jgi:hypothetical protein
MAALLICGGPLERRIGTDAPLCVAQATKFIIAHYFHGGQAKKHET